VDPGNSAVIAHTAAVKPKTFNDIEEAARAMKRAGQPSRLYLPPIGRSAEKCLRLLEKKFQEALRKAKESPDMASQSAIFDPINPNRAGLQNLSDSKK
jgi:hypothetical protein